MSERLLRSWIREALISEASVGSGGGGLLKYRSRIASFLDHVQNNKPFTLVGPDGKAASDQTYIVTGPVVQDLAIDLNEMLRIWDSLGLPSKWPGGRVSAVSQELADVLKRFNANLSRSVTPVGPLALNRIFKTRLLGGRGNPEAKEDAQIGQINEAIARKIAEQGTDPMTGIAIKTGQSTVATGITSCDKVQAGKPKADAMLLRSDATQAAWMSLKFASNGSQMNQWGGVGGLIDYPEVMEFARRVKLQIWDAERLGKPIYTPIQDAQLAYKGTFGKAASPGGPYGVNNINMIIASQSKIDLVQVAVGVDGLPVYEFSNLSGGIWYNGDIPGGEGGWTPVLAARYTSGRGGNLGLENVRVGIFPVGQAKWEAEVGAVESREIAALHAPSFDELEPEATAYFDDETGELIAGMETSPARGGKGPKGTTVDTTIRDIEIDDEDLDIAAEALIRSFIREAVFK